MVSNTSPKLARMPHRASNAKNQYSLFNCILVFGSMVINFVFGG
jgi:hypothetical protein